MSLLASGFVLSGGSLMGATLASWNFDDDTTGLESAAPDAVFQTTTIGDWTPSDHDGLGNLTGGLSTGSDNYFIRSNDGTINSTNPTTSTTYLSFTITVGGLAAGDVLNITNVSYDHFAQNLETSDSFFGRLYTDAVGYTGVSDSITSPGDFNTNAGYSPSGDLSGVSELQGLTNGTVVEFRLYIGDNSSQSNGIHRIDNFLLEGEVVPEPSIALLGGLGLLGLLRRRRD